MLLTRLHLAIIGALAAILLVVSVVQTVRLHGFLWVDGALDELADTRRDLTEARQAIREAHEESLRLQGEVDRKLEQGRVNRDIADREAERIERAELPGGCKTPKAVLEADV
jgi:uncharacterized protein YoxC